MPFQGTFTPSFNVFWNYIARLGFRGLNNPLNSKFSDQSGIKRPHQSGPREEPPYEYPLA